ncbi:(d)CMP kinase [Desulfofundulus thermocisternus]|uniref:(d)CMP kinase n=1 Tax=Desulfofundulus thermocisternus TaxID=42471 RepID=UPI0019EA8C0C|nr:(d)CMP kinase [Desulfofundulus thermocisternus]MBE3584586.1 (d)CMP kinase [Thermoanaerobacter sp.]MCS5696599.1 (d)CMP kinase [Desulfofundulus thermocisternus]
MVSRQSIAIDGPAGAGKSTVARELARRLGWLYIDTGAMYRALTLKALRRGLNLKDEKSLEALARESRIEMTTDPGYATRIYLDGEDVTRAIREPEVSRHVSLVARLPGVREVMVHRQREMAESKNVIMDGRDVGTVVLPDAGLKIFLTASPEARARRRQQDLQAQGHHVPLDLLIREIAERDRLDSSRPVAPLMPAPDAWVIDSSNLSVEQVVEMITARVRGRFS